MNELFTIGYSSYDISSFIGTLKGYDILAVADVRSSPYSGYKPDYNREILKDTLNKAGIYYVFLGEELGARSKDNDCYIDGRADHALISRTALFQKGIDRILNGLQKYRIALMCAEIDPIICHRNILVCRMLRKYEIAITHILNNGRSETNSSTEKRLMKEYSIENNDLFLADKDLLELAYAKRSVQIAFRIGDNEDE